jgi:GNAT superfamily N-acetyltransferase
VSQQIDLTIRGSIQRTPRVQQLEAMFDVPASEKLTLRWQGDVPLDERPWNVGLIVGPSGCGKSQLLQHLFGSPADFPWGAPSVVDDFEAGLSIEQISGVCQAVGFNTIPAWMRPFHVLSNGERFRVELARRLLECGDPILVDEFTSVVDRQVAQIGAHAVQRYVRKHNRRFVAASCHYDIVEWLQPDWILEPATMTFQWRSLQRRPALECRMGRVPYTAWRLFSKYHYLTANLNKAARCFGLWVGDTLAAFSAVLHRPHPRAKDVYGISRVVTLPDWQGLGLASTLDGTLGAAFKGIGKRLRAYPAHPARIRTLDRSEKWALIKRPGLYSPRAGATTTVHMGGRPCAVFEYVGPALPMAEAERFLGIGR